MTLETSERHGERKWSYYEVFNVSVDTCDGPVNFDYVFLGVGSKNHYDYKWVIIGLPVKCHLNAGLVAL